MQFVPESPSEIDSLNEAWAQIRSGSKVALRFEDFDAGVPQVKIIISGVNEDDDDNAELSEELE